MKILFATKNNGKIKEIKEIFNDTSYEICSLNDVYESIDIDENADTFEGNAIIKALAIMKEAGVMVLADDSGLEVDYLNKEPGVYSARFLGEDTPQSEKNTYIMKQLEGVEDRLRTARFVCAMACAMPGKEPFTIRGTIEGYIPKEAKGDNGFGYDPIFYVPEFNKTMAQLTMEEKNEISHRGQALRKMKQEILRRGYINNEDK